MQDVCVFVHIPSPPQKCESIEKRVERYFTLGAPTTTTSLDIPARSQKKSVNTQGRNKKRQKDKEEKGKVRNCALRLWLRANETARITKPRFTKTDVVTEMKVVIAADVQRKLLNELIMSPRSGNANKERRTNLPSTHSRIHNKFYKDEYIYCVIPFYSVNSKDKAQTKGLPHSVQTQQLL